MFYVGIVLVGRHIHLWCNSNRVEGEVSICDKHSRLCLADLTTTNCNGMQDVEVQTRSVILSDLTSCDGWPDSSQQCEALKPHCMNTITYWDPWHISPVACGYYTMCPQWGYEELYCHSVEVWVYKPSKSTINRSHCPSTEMNKLKQQSAVDNQNTKDDLKILLRILLSQKLSQWLPYYVLLIYHYMSQNRLTECEK